MLKLLFAFLSFLIWTFFSPNSSECVSPDSLEKQIYKNFSWDLEKDSDVISLSFLKIKIMWIACDSVFNSIVSFVPVNESYS